MTDQIVPAVLPYATFETHRHTWGVEHATVTFTTAGQVDIGSTLVLEMPDLIVGSEVQSGWRFEKPDDYYLCVTFSRIAVQISPNFCIVAMAQVVPTILVAQVMRQAFMAQLVQRTS